jgi:D-sedoheptulose 7-phosphate isomerase
MSTLAGILAGSGTSSEFAAAYLRHLSGLLAALDVDAIAAFTSHLERARVEGRTIFLTGNGGSAATASHMANDLGLCDTKGGPAFRAHALTDGVPIMTAIANDFGYQHLFTRQLSIHYRPGDVLVVISASGNSPNVVEAASWVRERGGVVLGMLGFDGGALAGLCDVAVVARTAKGEYGPVEDVHMILDHLMTLWLRRSLEAQGQAR